jgi:hypothetical protein
MLLAFGRSKPQPRARHAALRKTIATTRNNALGDSCSCAKYADNGSYASLLGECKAVGLENELLSSKRAVVVQFP